MHTWRRTLQIDHPNPCPGCMRPTARLPTVLLGLLMIHGLPRAAYAIDKRPALNHARGRCKYSVCDSPPVTNRQCQADMQCVCNTAFSSLMPPVYNASVPVVYATHGCCFFNGVFDATTHDCECNDLAMRPSSNHITEYVEGLGMGCCPDNKNYFYNSSAQQCICKNPSYTLDNQCRLPQKQGSPGLTTDGKATVAAAAAFGVPAVIFGILTTWAAVATTNEHILGPRDTLKKCFTKKKSTVLPMVTSVKLVPESETAASPSKA